jgi:hypothetical protein
LIGHGAGRNKDSKKANDQAGFSGAKLGIIPWFKQLFTTEKALLFATAQGFCLGADTQADAGKRSGKNRLLFSFPDGVPFAAVRENRRFRLILRNE